MYSWGQGLVGKLVFLGEAAVPEGDWGISMNESINPLISAWDTQSTKVNEGKSRTVVLPLSSSYPGPLSGGVKLDAETMILYRLNQSVLSPGLRA